MFYSEISTSTADNGVIAPDICARSTSAKLVVCPLRRCFSDEHLTQISVTITPLSSILVLLDININKTINIINIEINNINIIVDIYNIWYYINNIRKEVMV